MQAGEVTIEDHSVGSASLDRLARLLADFFVRLFGCWHVNMGRPVTVGGETYRACLDCGARRRFDLNGWNTYGPYYFLR